MYDVKEHFLPIGERYIHIYIYLERLLYTHQLLYIGSCDQIISNYHPSSAISNHSFSLGSNHNNRNVPYVSSLYIILYTHHLHSLIYLHCVKTFSRRSRDEFSAFTYHTWKRVYRNRSSRNQKKLTSNRPETSKFILHYDDI